MCFRNRSKVVQLLRVRTLDNSIPINTIIVSPSRAMLSLSHVVHSTSMLKFAVRSPSSSVRIVISLSSSCSFFNFRLISASNRFRNSFSVIQLQFKFNSRLLRFSLVPFGAGSPSITSGSNSNYVRTLRRSTIRIQQSTRKIVEFQVNQVLCYQLPIRVASVARSRCPPSWRKKNRIDPLSRIVSVSMFFLHENKTQKPG